MLVLVLVLLLVLLLLLLLAETSLRSGSACAGQGQGCGPRASAAAPMDTGTVPLALKMGRVGVEAQAVKVAGQASVPAAGPALGDWPESQRKAPACG